MLWLARCTLVLATVPRRIVGEVGGSVGAGLLQLSGNGTGDHAKAFELAYRHFTESFDFAAYNRSMRDLKAGMNRLRHSSYAYLAKGPHCDKGPAPSPLTQAASQVTGVSAFPGGAVQSVLGLDVSKMMFDMMQGANGPGSAGVALPMMLAQQGLSMGAGLVQAVVSAVVHVVPPLIPPPVWTNQPLTCMPMITGHNCFGAVLYPITMADFIIADVTDSMMDGYIASFPTTYARKVGKTSDNMYKACFSSYMSMLCSSIFPMCTAPMARDEPMPVGGRVPMCFHNCILPLVLCPGFWIGDVIGQCQMVSVPPMCSQAVYWNVWRLPPQLSSFDDAHPFPSACPAADAGEVGLDAVDDLTLYDAAPLPESPILRYAGKPAKLPPVRTSA